MRITILIILLSIVTPSSVFGQWTRTNGPQECSPTSLIRISSGILCGTPQGIYITHDEGQTWQDFTTFPAKKINALYNIADTISVLYSSGYLEYDTDSMFSCVSYDGGQNWMTPQFIGVDRYINSHSYEHTIVCAMSFSNLCYSADFGLSWVILPVTAYDIDFFDSTFVAYTTTHKYWSNGSSPSLISFDTSQFIWRAIIDDSIFIGFHIINTASGALFKSLDSGNTWQFIKNVTWSGSLEMHAFNHTAYYYGYVSQYIASADYGNTWNMVSEPHEITYPFRVSLLNGDELDIKSVNSSYGNKLVHYVMPAGPDYISDSGIVGSYIQGMISNSHTLFAGSYPIYKSTDDGMTWDTVLSYLDISSTFAFGDTLFAEPYWMYSSYDNGVHWTVLPDSGLSNSIVKFNNRLYNSNRPFFTSWGIFYSSDYGNSWTITNPYGSSTTCNTSVREIGSLAMIGPELFMCDDYGNIFKYDSISNGWSLNYCVTTNSYIYTNLQSFNDVLIATIDSQLYVSTDTGQTWLHPSMNGLPLDIHGAKVCPHSLVGSYGDIIGQCGKYGIYYSYNLGSDWFPLTPSVPFIPISLTIKNNQLFAGSFYQGVWTTSTPLGILNDETISNHFKIYPQPATENVILEYTGIKKRSLLYRIFDITGKDIFEFTSNSSNSHISLENFESGVYYVQVMENNKPLAHLKLLVVR